MTAYEPAFDQTGSGFYQPELTSLPYSFLLQNDADTATANWAIDLINTTSNSMTQQNISLVYNPTVHSTRSPPIPPLVDPSAYFGDVFMHLNIQYRQVHGELSLAVCVFGIIANVLNIIVLSRKNMISPTNAILTGMAVSDLVVIACYIPFVIHNFMRQSVPLAEMYTYGWAVYTLVHAHVTVAFHTISIWLTVLLAVWRYTTVRSPASNKSSCSMARARVAIVSTYILVPLFCIPVFVCFTIHPFTNKAAPNATLYKVDMIQLDSNHKHLLEKINFWAFSILLKLIPCILLTYLSLALVRILIEARKRKERLLGGAKFAHRADGSTSGNSKSTSGGGSTNMNPNRRESQNLVVGPRNGRAGSMVPQETSVYLEMGDNSPTEYDEVSRNSDSDAGSGFWWNLTRICHPLSPKGYRHSLRKCTQCCTSSLCFCLPCVSAIPGTPSPEIRLTVQNKRKSSAVVDAHNRSQHHQRAMSHSSGNSERTTRMLIAVLIMFLICEFPSGILALLSGILGKVFFTNVYNNFGEIMDMLALINSAVNFVLYCLMSQQFRKTFSQLFCVHWTEEISSGGGGGGPGGTGSRSGGGAGPKAGGRRASGLVGNGRRVSTRPEATVATDLVATPPEEHRMIRDGEMERRKHELNGSTAVTIVAPKPPALTKRSPSQSSSSSVTTNSKPEKPPPAAPKTDRPISPPAGQTSSAAAAVTECNKTASRANTEFTGSAASNKANSVLIRNGSLVHSPGCARDPPSPLVYPTVAVVTGLANCPMSTTTSV